MKFSKFLLIFFIFFIFCYFRIVPIINQTVPYTYDQGRDFLKVEEIVRYKNPTFIGPSTGIMGIYHGAWWYYFLSIPYLIFDGKPIGFAVFLFLFNLLLVVLFFVFIIKNFDLKTGIFFLIITTCSPYLILTSNFVISSVLVIPFLLLLFYSTYKFFKTKKSIFQFLIFLSLGFIFEAEIPFGVFLIPSYFIALFFCNLLNQMAKNRKNLFFSFLIFLIPLSLRILFEIKNNFPQTRTAISYLISGKIHNPHSLIENFVERLNLFLGFYLGLFENKVTAVIIGLFFLITTYFGIRRMNRVNKQYFIFNLMVFTLLFFTSLLYRDNFWANYFEGLSYFYLILFLPSFFSLKKIGKGEILKTLIIGFLLVDMFFVIKKNFDKKRSHESMGLVTHLKVINYLYEVNKNKEFCLRIYTPPVIPYTYEYLFAYYSRTQKLKKPVNEYVNNQCWYIIEKDQYQFRTDKWREENIPRKSRKIKQHNISDNVSLELWAIEKN